ncbi:MAG TPA: hypothetical protein VJZ76_06910 [Thermoanaerobaculia bacterium]|nr:hypothetical protein [Thermoanaerobaculia bacterium]
MRTAQALLLSILFTGAASAQTFEQLGFLRLNDTTPRSTRAVALGGASDPADADMAANPATLASVKRPMFLLQAARNSLGTTQFLNPVTSQPNSIGSSSLSQGAVAVPLGNIVLGVYAASEPRVQGPGSGATSFGVVPYGRPICMGLCSYYFPLAEGSFARHERRYGVALAEERGAFAFGLGAEVQRVEETAEIVRLAIVTIPLASAPGPTTRVFRRVDGRAIVPNAGVRWRVSPRLALAAAYNGAGSFTRTMSACNIQFHEWLTCTSALTQIGSSAERLPDAIRAGASFAATEHLRLAAEAVRRNYSHLASDESTIFDIAQRWPYRNVTELHAGVEYTLSSLPLSLRAGWWRDPSRFDAEQFVFPAPPAAINQSVRHTTFGAGVNVGSARFDVAYDHSSLALQRRAVAGITFGL